jgi:pimeloyl-ACP methyl ester carboxylesterase
MTSRRPAIQDSWVQGRQGRLFVRSWTPHGTHALAPLILLHDSLGSVDLWRGFPAALCEATGRMVVAYDRLGFGQSDPHPDAPDSDFVAAEAGGIAAAKELLRDPQEFGRLERSWRRPGTYPTASIRRRWSD